MRKYFGTDGIRGPVGTPPITADFVLKLGWAAGKTFSPSGGGTILIGKDTRISGYLFESALEVGLASAGVHVTMLGPMPTPAVAYLTRAVSAQAGIVISASHNPYSDNGIKFFSSDGRKLPDEMEAEIERLIDEPMTTVASANLGKADRMNDAVGRYIEFCKTTFPKSLNLKHLKLVVDCAHGATYKIAPAVFQELGAEVIAIGCSPDGLNINEGFGATSPEALAARVVLEGADLGIALDGDGDRLVMVDHQGEVVDGDELLLIIALHQQVQGLLSGGVVGTLMSNLGLEVALEAHGIAFARALVGDRYVVAKLIEEGWRLGGEGSGHILCLDQATTGDGVVSALQVLRAISDQGKTLAELKSAMTKFPQVMINVRDVSALVIQSQKVRSAVRQVEGVLGNKGRVLLRPSGTEPLIRVMVEGEDAEQVARLAEQLAAVVGASED